MTLLVLLLACIDDPGPHTPLATGAAAQFELDVQPVLAASCANPSCHGTTLRPLELYATQRHRMDPSQDFVASPLTAAELDANRYRVAGFVDAHDPERSALLTKPLAPSAGGEAHGGDTQWGDPDEPDYLAVLAWIEAAAEEAR